MVAVQGIARLSLRDDAIGFGGAAQGCRAPERRAFPPARRRPTPVQFPMVAIGRRLVAVQGIEPRTLRI